MSASFLSKLWHLINLRRPFCFPNVIQCHSETLHTLTRTRRGHVRCRSHDVSSLSHHLLVSTYVSPVGAIRAVHRPRDPAWLRKTKRHPSPLVCRSVVVASMSQSWRDWGPVPLPAVGRGARMSGAVNYLLKHPGPGDVETTCQVFFRRVTRKSSTSTHGEPCYRDTRRRAENRLHATCDLNTCAVASPRRR